MWSESKINNESILIYGNCLIVYYYLAIICYDVYDGDV